MTKSTFLDRMRHYREMLTRYGFINDLLGISLSLLNEDCEKYFEDAIHSQLNLPKNVHIDEDDYTDALEYFVKCQNSYWTQPDGSIVQYDEQFWDKYCEGVVGS